MKNTLFIIDAYNLIYRMFYAIPEMTTRSGDPVNAIFGVAKFLKGLADENPDALMVVATDVGKSFRADLFTEYKGTRERMPDNLRSQIDGVFTLFSAAGIQVLSEEGYEADDIIGTIAHQHENNSYQVVIISSDKDLCQFVRDGHVHIYDAMKRKFMKEADVLEKFGVPAHQVRDYLAIVGDASDNIPGIAGFGPKKAVDLLSKYGSLEGIYNELGIVNGEWGIDGKWQYTVDTGIFEKCDLSPKLKQGLVDNIQNAFLSQKLAHIVTDLTIPPLPTAPFGSGIFQVEYITLLQQYEFRSLIPASSLAPKPVLESYEVTEISTMTQLENLIHQIKKDAKQITLSTDIHGKIVIAIHDAIYNIDSKKVDCAELATLLIDTDIEIVGYDLKSDLKRLYAIQKPPVVGGSEGQGRLF